jgi:hypothetical protein
VPVLHALQISTTMKASLCTVLLTAAILATCSQADNDMMAASDTAAQAGIQAAAAADYQAAIEAVIAEVAEGAITWGANDHCRSRRW